MDPNATLVTIRQLVAVEESYRSEEWGNDLARATASLDCWMSYGGAPPVAWDHEAAREQARHDIRVAATPTRVERAIRAREAPWRREQ
jgi:hypothetical protein